MKINDYVIVINKDSELYRRRCQITSITPDGKYVVYSEGLEEEEKISLQDLKPSKF